MNDSNNKVPQVAYVEVKEEDATVTRLKRNVILAWTDNNAIGSRAALGIDARVEYKDLMDCVRNERTKGFSAKLKPACSRNSDDLTAEQLNFFPLQVLNLKYEDYSFVILNTHLTAENAYIPLAILFDLCLLSGVEKLIVVCQLHMGAYKVRGRTKIFENVFFAHHMTGYPSLPDEVEVSDPVLLTLMRMVQVEQIGANVFVVPGFRGPFGPADDASTGDAKEQIKLVQELIADITGLKFDLNLSASLLYCDTRPLTTGNTELLYA